MLNPLLTLAVKLAFVMLVLAALCTVCIYFTQAYVTLKFEKEIENKIGRQIINIVSEISQLEYEFETTFDVNKEESNSTHYTYFESPIETNDLISSYQINLVVIKTKTIQLLEMFSNSYLNQITSLVLKKEYKRNKNNRGNVNIEEKIIINEIETDTEMGTKIETKKIKEKNYKSDFINSLLSSTAHPWDLVVEKISNLMEKNFTKMVPNILKEEKSIEIGHLMLDKTRNCGIENELIKSIKWSNSPSYEDSSTPKTKTENLENVIAIVE